MALRRLFGRASALPIITAVLLCVFLIAQFRSQYAGFHLGPAPQLPPPRVEIVVASQTSEDTSWVDRHLSDWARSIYVTDDPSAKLTVPKNKGREAMVYLTWVWVFRVTEVLADAGIATSSIATTAW